ncbi:hypothetical protein FGADI_13490 [Fusarium gaditjirri]|uniref:Uncharacterized protein n=1 Tax=Fusarium gaditjirri TaxID=282569 RepID=A0A8H4WMR5_9HYPO|nr:hypothetical protein FGADI_13490 [Fusarium gaditjirri]
MTPRRDRHHLNGQREIQHKVSATPNFYSLDVEPNVLDTVQAWLSQVHDYASHKDSEPHFTQDLDDDYMPNWKPHNLCVVPISRDYHQFRHSGNRALDQRLASPKSDLLENYTYSESQHEPFLDTGSDNENGKRSLSHLTQNSHEDRSNKRFERQPRKKTRPDRYTSKDAEDKRDPTTESQEKRPRKKSRSKKQEIRASRDIMNNFVSGAIPNTRVTMRPNLTAGLFLNGRSSAYGRGIGTTFNDMTFTGTCEEKGKADEIPQDIASENSSGQDDASNGGYASRSATELPRTITNDEEGEVQNLVDDGSQENQQNNIQKVFETHSGSVSSTETTQASDYETPEAMLKTLIETGIFDGTAHLHKINLQFCQHRPAGSSGLVSAVFPREHSEIYLDNREIQHDGRQLTQPDYCENGETIHEFIKRIEGEVSMKWDNSQQFIGAGCIDDIEECAKGELFRMDNNGDLLQCSDIEHDAAIQSSLHGIFSSSDQGSASADQEMAEDWEHPGYEQSRYWTGKYYDEHGVSDAKMVGFWRPNHF